MTDPVTQLMAHAPHWTLLYAGLNGLLSFGLAFRVGARRMKANVIFGAGDDPALQRAIRAHSNNVEYVPLALVLIGFIEMAGEAPWLIHGLGSALFLGRALHAYGLSLTEESSPGRFYGILLTWGVLLVASVWSIALAVF